MKWLLMIRTILKPMAHFALSWLIDEITTTGVIITNWPPPFKYLKYYNGKISMYIANTWIVFEKDWEINVRSF